MLYLSPDDSNSTSSPVQVREAVLGDFGGLNGVPIRTWELVNYYSFAYAAAKPGQVRVTPELANCRASPTASTPCRSASAARPSRPPTAR